MVRIDNTGDKKAYFCEKCGKLFNYYGMAENHERWECDKKKSGGNTEQKRETKSITKNNKNASSIDKPKYTKLETEEEVLHSYTDNSAWMTRKLGGTSEKHGVGYLEFGFGVHPGTLYITNKKIIFEDLDSSNTIRIFPYDIMNTTTGSDGRFASGEITIFFEDGTTNDSIAFHSGKVLSDYINSNFLTDEAKEERIINKAKIREEHLDYHRAIELYESIGRHEEAARVRRNMYDEKKVDQTVVHGDYVDDRDTIVKDSVINKSNIGSGGDDKLTKIKELKELLDSGAIDDDEFKQMKKEILGK